MTPAENLSKAMKASKKPGRHGKRRVVWKSRLRELREQLGLTQRAVSNACNLAGQSIHMLEKGTDPQLVTARVLATFYGKRVEDIWTELLEETND